MKTRLAVFSMALAATLFLLPSPAKAVVEFQAGIQIQSVADFYTPLTTYGEWVDVPSRGRCWHPLHLEAGWRPYTRGQWEWTDVGWYWASDEPFGWACYHYGSWVDEPKYGWLWLPGLEWAPAWVTWRYSDDFIGWAPCGPNLTALPAEFFVFADIHNFRHHRFETRDLAPRNPELINRTRVVQSFPRETRRFDSIDRTVTTDPGPGIEPIQRATGQTFAPERIQNMVRQPGIPQVLPRTQTPGEPPVRDPQFAPAPVLPEPRSESLDSRREPRPESRIDRPVVIPNTVVPPPPQAVRPEPPQRLTPTGHPKGDEPRRERDEPKQ